MALTKTFEEDRIEVCSEYKHVLVRTAAVIKEDGTELSRTFQRKSLECGHIDPSNNWVDTDISGESTDVQGICNTVWTQAVKDAWKAKLIADRG